MYYRLPSDLADSLVEMLPIDPVVVVVAVVAAEVVVVTSQPTGQSRFVTFSPPHQLFTTSSVSKFFSMHLYKIVP